MEDLLNLLYDFKGEFGKPSSPIFVWDIHLKNVLLFKSCYFGIRKSNNIIYYKL